jgi:hypothetical protein
MTIQLGAIYLAPEVGFYFIFILLIVLSFGALLMNARDTAFVWTYSTVGLSALLLMTDKAIAMPMTTWTERALLLASAVTAMGRCASTGLYGRLADLAQHSGGERYVLAAGKKTAVPNCMLLNINLLAVTRGQPAPWVDCPVCFFWKFKLWKCLADPTRTEHFSKI